jgi:hypothetical protein
MVIYAKRLYMAMKGTAYKRKQGRNIYDLKIAHNFAHNFSYSCAP